MANILVIEDEVGILRFIQLELTHEGYNVDLADNGIDGLNKIMTGAYDLVLLDVMLPGMNGFDVCRTARSNNINTPIIMLTARDGISDKVSGLDLGADDYMTKPFAIEELLARMRVALNRHSGNNSQPANQEIIQYEQLVLNLSSRTAFYGQDEIVLTKKEFDLLAYLLINKNIAVGRETILNEVWAYDYLGDTNVVDVYIRYLRQKIDDKYGIKLINTVRGVGYIIKDN